MPTILYVLLFWYVIYTCCKLSLSLSATQTGCQRFSGLTEYLKLYLRNTSSQGLLESFMSIIVANSDGSDEHDGMGLIKTTVT